MRYRTFGRSGLRVAEAFLGAMTFGEQGGVGAPLEECRRILDTYAEAGGNVVDTAINYRGGASEEILGELLVGRRDSFVIASKYTVSRDRSDPNGGGNHRKNLRLSLDLTLQRLRTDHLDVLWVHMWDRSTPTEEMMRALDDEVRRGRVLYVGISDAPAWIVAQANTLADWRGWTPFCGIQVPYSLLQRDVERDLLPMADAFGLAVAAWSPLAGGILSGKYTSGREVEAGTRIDPASLEAHQLSVATAVEGVASELGVSAAQVAIAWTRRASSSIHPILGARRLDQIVDNLGALDLVLPEEALTRLDAAAPFDHGFPTNFIDEISDWVFGAGRLP